MDVHRLPTPSWNPRSAAVQWVAVVTGTDIAAGELGDRRVGAVGPLKARSCSA